MNEYSGLRQFKSERPEQVDEFAAETVASLDTNIVIDETDDESQSSQRDGIFSAAKKPNAFSNGQEVIQYPSSFFKLKGSKGPDSLSYYCLQGDCQKKGKVLTAYINSRGNLRKHVTTQHGSQLEEFNRLCKAIDLEKQGLCSLKKDTTAESSSSQLKLQQQNLSLSGYPKSLTQDALDSYIVEYLVQGVHPVHETTKDFFKNFVQRLAPGKMIRSHAYYKDLIEKDFTFKKSLLKKCLALAPWVCTTADCWSSRGRQFLGVTVHWLDEKLQRKSACLAIKPVYGLCNYQTIAAKLESIYEEFDISRKVVATVTDNGSNFEKAFRTYGVDSSVLFLSGVALAEHSSCLNEEVATILSKTGLPQSSKARNERNKQFGKDEDAIEELLNDLSSDFSEYELDEVDSESDKELLSSLVKEENHTSGHVQAFQDDEEPDLFIPLTEILHVKSGVSSMFRLPPHRRCASHTLNLIAKDDIVKGSDTVFLEIKSAVEAKIRKITKLQRRSAKASQRIREELGGLLVQPNSTRWNSWFNAYKRMETFLAKKRSGVRNLFQHFKIPFFRPVEEDYINEFVRIMRPLAEALDILQGEINVSAAYLLPTLKILEEEMAILQNSGLKVCKNLPGVIKAAVKKRFASYFEDEQLIVATVLHPKFKVCWLPEEQRARNIKRVAELCECSQTDDQESESPVCASLPEESEDTQDYCDSPKRLKRDFFKSLSRGKESASELTEVELYLADSSDEIQMLEKYPTLKKLFRKYNATLPSSASCERLFSVTGRIFTPVRSRLSDKTFERLLFLKFNSKLEFAQCYSAIKVEP